MCMLWHLKSQFKTSSASAALNHVRLQDTSVQHCQRMPFGGTFFPDKWGPAGTPSHLLELHDKDVISVPGTELGDMRTQQKSSIGSGEEDPQANWKESCHTGSVCTELVGRFLLFQEHEQAIWHILSFLHHKIGLPAAQQCAWWDRTCRACWGMQTPVEQAFTGSDPAPAGLVCRAASGWSSAGSAGTPGVSPRIPAACAAHNTHHARTAHVYLDDAKYFSCKVLMSSSVLIILPFTYQILTVSA